MFINPKTTAQTLKQIVREALESKEKGFLHEGQLSIFNKLYAKRKLESQNKFQKVRRGLKIFSQLQNYIDFELVFEHVTKKVTQLFCEYCQLRNQSVQANQQYSLFLEHQKYFTEYSEFSQRLNLLQQKIAIEYGAIFKKSLKEEAARVREFLSQISVAVKINGHQPQYILNSQNNKLFKYKSDIKFPKNEASCRKLQKMHDSRNYQIRFSLSDRHELELYLRQALTFLVLAIQSHKNKCLKGISLSILNKDRKYVSLSRRNQNQKSVNEPETSASANKASTFWKSQRKQQYKNKQNYEVCSQASASKQKSHNKQLKSMHNMSQCSDSDQFLTELRPEVQIVQKPKSGLRKKNQKEFFLMKINKIVGSIEEQVAKNKLKKKCFDNYIQNVHYEYCEAKQKMKFSSSLAKWRLRSSREINQVVIQ